MGKVHPRLTRIGIIPALDPAAIGSHYIHLPSRRGRRETQYDIVGGRIGIEGEPARSIGPEVDRSNDRIVIGFEAVFQPETEIETSFCRRRYLIVVSIVGILI